MVGQNRKQIHRFFKKMIFFIVFLAILDVLLGRFIEIVFFLQPSGKYARLTKAINNTTADILIFGSSHAHRHYVPSILEEATGLKCYNAGTKGQRMIFNLALQEVIFNHHVPKITILSIDPKFVYNDEKQYEKLSDLLPYYRKNHELRNVLYKRGPYEKYKLLSHLYPYNSTLVHIVYFYLNPQKDFSGYRPLIGNIKPHRSKYLENNNDVDDAVDAEDESLKRDIDPNSIEALEKFIANCSRYGSKLIMIVSPNFAGNGYENDPSFNKIKGIVTQHKIPFINYSDNKMFALNGKYFHDFQHLNKNGARLFSHMVARQLLSIDGLAGKKNNEHISTRQNNDPTSTSTATIQQRKSI